jgi:DedD protein
VTESKPPASAKVEAAKGGFAVQLAAFSDDKGASALANRLKKAGYPAYTEPLKTTHGTLWRVRVGPYPSHEIAIGTRNKLKAEGQNGIVAAVHN